MAKIQGELLRGNIDTIILKCLFEGDKYGNEIVQAITDRTEGQFEIKQPTLYSSLTRLENQGLATCTWVTTQAGGRRKYFSITEAGREYFSQKQEEWEFSRTVVDRLISEHIFDLAYSRPDYQAVPEGAAPPAADDVAVDEVVPAPPEETDADTIVVRDDPDDDIVIEINTDEPDGAADAQPDEPVEKPDEVADTQPDEPVDEPDEAADTLPDEPVDEPDVAADTQPNEPVDEPDETADTQPDEPADEPDDVADTQPNEPADEPDETADTQPDETVDEPDVAADTQPRPKPEPQPTHVGGISDDFLAERIRALTSNAGSYSDEVAVDHDSAATLADLVTPPVAQPEPEPGPEPEPEPDDADVIPVRTDDETLAYSAARSVLYAPQPAPLPDHDDDDVITVTTRDDVRVNKSVSGGITYRKHDRELSRAYNAKYYIYSNRLRAVQYGVVGAIMLLELFIIYMSCTVTGGIRDEAWLYWVGLAIAIAVPVFGIVEYYTDKYKTRRIDEDPNRSLLYKFFIVLQCLVLTICVNILVERNVFTDATYLLRLIIPCVLATNFFVSGLLYKLLIRTRAFAVKE